MSGKVVKILSGPHLGAEVELAGLPLTLGSGPECDLVVDDRLAGQRHLTFVSWNGTAAVEFHEKGFVQGHAVAAGESVQVNDGDIVTVGSTYLCVGPSEGRWPEILLPDWVALNSAGPAGNGAPKDKSNKDPAAGSETAGQGGRATTEGAASGSEATGENHPRVAHDKSARPSSGRVMRRVVLLVLAAAAVSVPVFLFPGNYSEPGEDNAGERSVQEQGEPREGKLSLEDLCKTYGLTMETVNGVSRLSGEVAILEDLQNLRREALGLDPNLDVRVYARPEVVRAAAAVIAGYKYPVTVEGVEGGVLSLKGWAPTKKDWERVLVDISRDVPGVKQFDASVMFLSTVHDAIADELRQQDLRNVRIVLDNDTLQCAGTLPADKLPAWKECLVRWRERFTVIREVKDDTVVEASAEPAPAPGKESEPAPEIRIASVMFEPLRCFVTTAGATFYEGARFPGGYVVESIGKEGVVLRRGDERKEMRLLASDVPVPGENHGG